mmetsp:Transcript_129813/g.289593  ORF Transcript_129813/g.289593 Transcript_129813/m.289593 type:complete len:229 (+) Transcript_129813:97-783(+)
MSSMEVQLLSLSLRLGCFRHLIITHLGAQQLGELHHVILVSKLHGSLSHCLDVGVALRLDEQLRNVLMPAPRSHVQSGHALLAYLVKTSPCLDQLFRKFDVAGACGYHQARRGHAHLHVAFVRIRSALQEQGDHCTRPMLVNCQMQRGLVLRIDDVGVGSSFEQGGSSVDIIVTLLGTIVQWCPVLLLLLERYTREILILFSILVLQVRISSGTEKILERQVNSVRTL